MFKRANKITSLLVAAAAVVSLVPASAADVKTIDSQEGTIYNVEANGSVFYIDGAINDKDDAAYYFKDGKYTVLDDIDSGSEIAANGNLLTIDDGDYTLNFDDGTVVDDDTYTDNMDDVAAALRKAIKEDTEDRYDETATDTIKEKSDLLTDMFFGPGDWYSATYESADTSVNGGAEELNVYLDTKGNYIDADYNVGKIKVTTTNGSATIENTNDTYDLSSSEDDAISASVTAISTLGHDGDYLYRKVKVTVYLSDGISDGITKINGKSIAGSAFTDVNEDQSEISYYAVQKISKVAASGNIDGANYAKTVTTYTLSDEDGDIIEGIDGDGGIAGMSSIVDGKLNIMTKDSTKTSDNVKVRTYTLKSSNGYYYTDEGDLSTVDAEVSDDQGVAAKISHGLIYRLDGGYIYKYDNTDDWNKLYKVDGAFDEFAIGDDNNMVAWNEDDDVYSVISEKSTETTGDTEATGTTTDASATATLVKQGWEKAADGTWSYVKADGSKVTGWQDIGGVWYYLNTSGIMQTGWIDDNGTWYYCNESGAMLSNTTVDGYVLGANGAWIK